MTARVAEVLAIGDELVLGVAVDTNSAHIAHQLEQLGFEVRGLTVVGDDPDVLADAIRRCCERADLVVATGGLGPTDDDRTRQAAAAAAGVELRFDEASWRHIGALFRSRKRPLPERNRVQAYLPATAEVLRNDWGTAPGFALDIGGALFAALPGVPREMEAMLQARVLPLLAGRFGRAGALAFHELRVLGVHEAELGDRLAAFMGAGRNPRVGITAHFGLLTVRVVARDLEAAAAEELCARDVAAIRPLLGEFLLCEGVEAPAAQVVQKLRQGGLTIATAESCTAGMVAAELGAVPGVSEVLLAGYVTYDNAAKVRDLEVPEPLLAEHGAVSVEVAAKMAEGAARRAGARLALSVTGIAGPGGGTEEKPVGTVCFGLCLDGVTEAWQRQFPDLGRAFVRRRSVMEVLGAVLRRVVS
jgi:nicotinamide-nucleotide amidase